MPAKDPWQALMGGSKQRGVEIIAPVNPGQEGTPIDGAVHILMDRIVPDEHQPRNWDAEEHQAAFATLVESIRQRGLMHPISLRLDVERNIYVIISGEGRWRATKEIGLLKIKALVDYSDLTRREILLRQLEENTVRADLTIGERLSALTVLLTECDRAWIVANSSYWRHDSTLSRWATVAENRYLIDPACPKERIDIWELAEEKGITAAYSRIAERRQADRQEAGLLPIGRPAADPPPAAPVLAAPPPAAPAFAVPPPRPHQAEAAEEEAYPASGSPPAVAVLQQDGAQADARPVAPSRSPPNPTARPTRELAPRPAEGGVASPGPDQGFISIEGSRYTLATARALITGVQDSPELDTLRQILGHREYARWIGQDDIDGEVAGWKADLDALADYLEETSQMIRATVGAAAGQGNSG